MEYLDVPTNYDPDTQKLILKLDVNALNSAFPPMTYMYCAITTDADAPIEYGTGGEIDVRGNIFNGKVYFDVWFRENPSSDIRTMFCKQWMTLSVEAMEPENWTGCSSMEYVEYNWDGLKPLCLWYPKAMAAVVPEIRVEYRDTYPTPTVDDKLDISGYCSVGQSMITVTHASYGNTNNYYSYTLGSCTSCDNDHTFDFAATPTSGCCSLDVAFTQFVIPKS